MSAVLDALYHGRTDEANRLASERGAGSLSIHEAAALGVTARLEQLIDEDPSSVNAFAADGFQPLGLAAFFGRREAAELLLARGGEVNTPSRNAQGVTALHAALSSPDPSFAVALIDAGADVNAQQASGVTPLHETAYNGDLELTQLLLAHGADRSKTDSSGRSAAAMAGARGHSAVADLLEAAR